MKVSEYLDFFKKYGFVIVDGVLEPQDIKETISEIWSEVETFDWTPYNPAYVGNQASRNNPLTWEDTHFPTSREGFFGLVITEGKQAFKNRQNEIMYNIFKNIMGHEHLWASIDRYGIMRPTRKIPQGQLPDSQFRTDAVDPSGTLECIDRLDWETNKLWLHWDLNPWLWALTTEGKDYSWEEDFIQENNGTSNKGRPKLQGFLNMVDNRLGDGGFSCVPAFNTVLKEYATKTAHTQYAERQKKEYVFVEVHKDDPIQQQSQNIALRAGSLLIWSSELPHCNYPNTSNNFRMVQYVKMFEAQDNNPGIQCRRKIMKDMLDKSGAQVTTLGSKMLGLTNW